MTDLQASLIAIGAAIVVGVISYNKWQEWRAKKSVEQAFSPMQDDVLMGETGKSSVVRHEPVMDDLNDAAHGSELAGYAEDEDSSPSAIRSAALVEGATRRALLDDYVDCIIPLVLDTPVRGEKVTAAFQHLHLIGNKPVRVIGETEDEQSEEVAVGSVYISLQVGVQLATRSGALTELEFSDLVTRLNQLTDDLGAQPELPDMHEVMDHAHKLYQLVHEFDAQLSVNVRANQDPWPLATLRPALQRQGMELRPDGRLVMPDGEGGLLFSVNINANPVDDTSSYLTLLLPVPCVAPAREGFKAMSSFAKSLATRLSGTVIDDEGHALSDAALNEIAQQVHSFYDALDEAGIAAGSARALRLFG